MAGSLELNNQLETYWYGGKRCLKAVVSVTVVNVTEALVQMVFEDQFMRTHTLECDCEQCQHDIMALALNQLPPRYVSTSRGEAYVKAEYFNPQFQSDIVRELTFACQKVGGNPRHQAG